MRRRQLFKGAGILAAGGMLTPVIARAHDADAPRHTGSVLAQLNKKRLLCDIAAKHKFDHELTIVDVEERKQQLYLTLKKQGLSFELRSPDRGLHWFTS